MPESIHAAAIAHVFSDPRFLVWSGASKSTQHHYGTGGLAQHTNEVVELCRTLGENYEFSDEQFDVLLSAAAFHDFGKIWDYEFQSKLGNIDCENFSQDGFAKVRDSNWGWFARPHKMLIHHISRSALEWSEFAKDKGISERISDRVLHCILSHHGLRAYGSPVQPRTEEAVILHLADTMSARMDELKRGLELRYD